jgi:hypothetical protein
MTGFLLVIGILLVIGFVYVEKSLRYRWFFMSWTHGYQYLDNISIDHLPQFETTKPLNALEKPNHIVWYGLRSLCCTIFPSSCWEDLGGFPYIDVKKGDWLLV